MLQGELRDATEILTDTLSRSEASHDEAIRGALLNNLGQVSWKQGDLGKAEELLSEALADHVVRKDRRSEAAALYWLGETARLRGDSSRAEKEHSDSLAIRRSVGLRDEEVDSLEALARLALMSGNAERAATFTLEALAVLEAIRNQVPGPVLRAAFLAHRRSLISLLVNINTRPENPEAATDGFVAAEKGHGRALLDIVADRSGIEALPSDLANRRRKLREEMEMLSFRLSTGGQDSALLSRMTTLLREDDEIQASLHEILTRADPSVTPLASFSEFRERAKLPAGTALLEFHLAEESSFLWLVDAAGVRMFRLPPGPAIETRAAEVCRLFNAPSRRAGNQTSRASFRTSLEWLSRELLGQLPPGSLPRRIVIVPDGALQALPFAALDVAGEGKLGLQHDLIRVPSASYLMYARQPSPSGAFSLSFFALTDPVFSPDDPRIPEAARHRPGSSSVDYARLPFQMEIDQVKKLLPDSRVRILSGFDASAESVLSPHEQAAVLHLSTHAAIDDRFPERSRIALTNIDRAGRAQPGYLLPYQVSQLHLKGSIVVLSACRTALGKKVSGEGLIGFSTSLFKAGAAQLVLTISDVDAEGSSMFLSEVYRQYFGRGQNMEHSLTLARQMLQKSPRWEDPAYWAAFEIVGAPSEARRSNRLD